MEWVEHNVKPDLNAVNDYFQKRLHATESRPTPFPFTITHDSLGNTVYTSTVKAEETLSGNVPATLIASKEGKMVIHHNPHLLTKVAQGTIIGEVVGEGQEGKVYKIPLQTTTGWKDFALKYTFPIHNGGELGAQDIYTPGIDQMRVLQRAEQENPTPGVTFATPYLATLDITLAPYIPDTVSARLLRGQNHLSDKAKENLRSIVGKQTLEEIHSPFMEAYSQSTKRIKDTLQKWFEEQQDLPLVTKEVTFDTGNADPFLVYVPSLYTLYQAYQKNPELIEAENTQQLDVEVGKCLVVTEMTVGVH